MFSHVMYYPNFQVKIMLYLTVVRRSLTKTLKKKTKKKKPAGSPQNYVAAVPYLGNFDRGCHDTTFFKRNILYDN